MGQAYHGRFIVERRGTFELCQCQYRIWFPTFDLYGWGIVDSLGQCRLGMYRVVKSDNLILVQVLKKEILLMKK